MSDRLQDITSGRSEPKGRKNWLAGRSNRKQYWLLLAPAIVLLAVLATFFGAGANGASIFITLIMIRRFHDFGRTGWWAAGVNIVTSGVAAFFPVPGGLLYMAVLVTMGCIPGQPATNDFGPPPSSPRTKAVAETFS